MNDEEFLCPQGWDESELLAYLEGDSAPETALRLIEHLDSCPACTGAMKRLRLVRDLLESAPDAFHPSAEEIYWFALNGADPDSLLAEHMEGCESCRREASALKDTLWAMDIPEATMPASLEKIIDYEYPAARSAWVNRLLERLSQLTSALMRRPLLAVSTAAAALILAVLIVPMWRTQQIAGIRPQQVTQEPAEISSSGLPAAGAPSSLGEAEESKKASMERRFEAPRPVAPAVALNHDKDSVENEALSESSTQGSADALKKMKHKEEARLGAKPDSAVSGRIHSAQIPAAARRKAQIEVQITDPLGNPINWLNSSSAHAGNRGLLGDTRLMTPQQQKGKKENSANVAEFVHVIVSERENYFDLEVQLVERIGNSTKVRASLNAQRIFRDNVQSKIDELVSDIVAADKH